MTFVTPQNNEVLVPGTSVSVYVQYDNRGTSGTASSWAANYVTYLAVLKDGEEVLSRAITPSGVLEFYKDIKLTVITLSEPGTYTFRVATANGVDAPDVRAVHILDGTPITSKKLVTLAIPEAGKTYTSEEGVPLYVNLHALTQNGETLTGDGLYSPISISVLNSKGQLDLAMDVSVRDTSAFVGGKFLVTTLDFETGGVYTIGVKAAASSAWDTAEVTVEGPPYPLDEADNPGYYCMPEKTKFNLDLNGNKTARIDYTLSIYQEEDYASLYVWTDDWSVGKFNKETPDAFNYNGSAWVCNNTIEYTAVKTGEVTLHLYISTNGHRRYDHHEVTLSIVDTSHAHQWGTPTYTWAEDHRTVTARRVCAACGEEQTETATADYTVARSPGENVKGKRTYTSAAFQNSAFKVQKVTVEDIPPLSQMTCLKLPADLKEISAGAFQRGAFDCVLIPDGCTTIGAGAFKNCANLLYVRIPRSATSIAADAFEGCGDVVLDYMTQ